MMTERRSVERTVRDICREPRKKYSAEEKYLSFIEKASKSFNDKGTSTLKSIAAVAGGRRG